MKATEQYFPVVLFIVLYNVVRTFEFVDEILKYDHSNESHLLCKVFPTFTAPELRKNGYLLEQTTYTSILIFYLRIYWLVNYFM